jgi:hypothetical protein
MTIAQEIIQNVGHEKRYLSMEDVSRVIFRPEDQVAFMKQYDVVCIWPLYYPGYPFVSNLNDLKI